MSWPQDSGGTKRLAEVESRTRSADVWLLVAAVASLAVVVMALVQSSSQKSATAVASVLLSVLSVALSWALVNAVYAFKYARLYYLDEPDDAGIDFKQRESPTYADFAYLAFTVGMSFGVSETEPTATRVRRVALGHALLSYAFGTGVLAVSINWSPISASDRASTDQHCQSAGGRYSPSRAACCTRAAVDGSPRRRATACA
jgi:uncharacterized membrane protein